MKPDCTTAPLQQTIDALQRALRSGELTLSTLEHAGGVLLHAPSEQLVTLNETGCTILHRLEQGPATPDDVVEAVLAAFEVRREAAERDCHAFLQRLHDVLQRR
jgi:hypothetical protein